jgi:hypothetical protein
MHMLRHIVTSASSIVSAAFDTAVAPANAVHYAAIAAVAFYLFYFIFIFIYFAAVASGAVALPPVAPPCCGVQRHSS